MTSEGVEPGKFITLEGTEGVGKSTHLQFVADYLREQGKTVITTREPGGTPVAERIREILLHSEPGTVSDRCELLLMFAARASHLDELIWPARERGDWVVCDRFTDATYAYQGAGRGLPDRAIAELETWVMGSVTPDLTILLDASPEVTAERRQSRGLTDRFEQEKADFFTRVRTKYLELAARNPERIKLLDAGNTIGVVEQELVKILDHVVALID
jgi:dTMP kinase